MRVQLNDQAISQLGFIMEKSGYKNQQHCLQVLISTVANRLLIRNKREACK
jgi:hypothetical protein